jgi:hypothetical protein
MVCHPPVVGGDKHGHGAVGAKSQQQCEYSLTRCRVQVTGWLVREQ